MKVAQQWVRMGRVQSFMLILGRVELGRIKKIGPMSSSGFMCLMRQMWIGTFRPEAKCLLTPTTVAGVKRLAASVCV